MNKWEVLRTTGRYNGVYYSRAWIGRVTDRFDGTKAVVPMTQRSFYRAWKVKRASAFWPGDDGEAIPYRALAFGVYV